MFMTKKIVFTLSLAIFALGGLFAPVSAQALTSAEIKAALDKSMAEYRALVTQIKNYSTSRNGYLPRDLKPGDNNSLVRKLQVFLNADPDTAVATAGVRSAGQEDNSFEALTKAAVIKFQEKYAADILTPSGLTAGTGKVSIKTREQINRLAPTLLKLDSALGDKAVSDYSSLNALSSALAASPDLKYWAAPVSALGLLGATPSDLAADYASTSDLIADLAETGQAAELANLFAAMKNLGGTYASIETDFGGLPGFLSTIRDNIGANRLPYLTSLFINLKAVGGTWADVTIDSGFGSLKALIESLSQKDNLEDTAQLLKELADLQQQLDDLLAKDGNLADLERELCRYNDRGYYDNGQYGDMGDYCSEADRRAAAERGNRLSDQGRKSTNPQSDQQRAQNRAPQQASPIQQATPRTPAQATNSTAPLPTSPNSPANSTGPAPVQATESATGQSASLFTTEVINVIPNAQVKTNQNLMVMAKGAKQDSQATVAAGNYKVFVIERLGRESMAVQIIRRLLASAGGTTVAPVPRISYALFDSKLSTMGAPFNKSDTDKTLEGYGYVGPDGQVSYKHDGQSQEMDETEVKTQLSNDNNKVTALKEKIGASFNSITSGDKIRISFRNTKTPITFTNASSSEFNAYVIDRISKVEDKSNSTAPATTPAAPAAGNQSAPPTANSNLSEADQNFIDAIKRGDPDVSVEKGQVASGEYTGLTNRPFDPVTKYVVSGATAKTSRVVNGLVLTRGGCSANYSDYDKNNKIIIYCN
jgi:hypothetical protein